MASAKAKKELIKEKSRGLRGSIAEELAQDTEHFEKPTTDLLKFHGIYQQDDRDVRRERLKQKLPKAYYFMVRTKNPGGGELSPEQWDAVLDICDRYANGTLRITTRQDFQFHGVGKRNLKRTIRALNERYVSTYGACGDGNRNTMACPVSDIAQPSRFNAVEWAKKVSRHLSFQSTAYYEIWLNGERLAGESTEKEPLYGRGYLPRKFKIAFSSPEDNCTDALTNDIAIFALTGSEGLEGFNVFVGGGVASTHGNLKTYPRLAEPLAFAEPDELLNLVTRIVEIQRDHGNRENRKRARMKYLVDLWGIDRFREELEMRLGSALDNPRPMRIQRVEQHLGWTPEKTDGLWMLGLFVENGRIKDTTEMRLKSGLTALIRRFGPGIRLTPSQDIILTHIHEEDRAEVEGMLVDHGISVHEQASALRLQSLACPALPTCGLAITEAERYLPSVINDLEAMGYGDLSLTLRMSGCPNACSRPPVAELGLMGTSRNAYTIYVGGSPVGTRLATAYADDVPPEKLIAEIAGLLDAYRTHSSRNESFGDFCHRIGVAKLRACTGTETVLKTEPWKSPLAAPC